MEEIISKYAVGNDSLEEKTDALKEWGVENCSSEGLHGQLGAGVGAGWIFSRSPWPALSLSFPPSGQ